MKRERRIKSLMSLGLLPIACLFIYGIQADAQTPKRILFAKGKSSAVVKGTTGDYGVTYVIKAKSGQKLVLDLKPDTKVGIKVETKGRFGEMVMLREERGGHYEIGLEESGDYTIFIGPVETRVISFTLKVRITKLADI
ncbi:MAG: hypothetical protein ACT4O9_04835 [Blastocatellia bacterium]